MQTIPTVNREQLVIRRKHETLVACEFHKYSFGST